MKTTILFGLSALLAASVAPSLASAQRVDGAIQNHGFFQQQIRPDEMQIVHGSEFKGAHKVAISSFNVAFPSEQHITATTKGHSIGGWSSSAKAYMDTSLTGVDKATQQRIADKAYALLVEQLTGAGYEVIDQNELGRMAPEFKTWPALENYTQGRFGAYVAPTGQQVRFLQGDASKRDVSGALSNNLASMGRVLDRPIVFDRSAYIAHDGAVGIIAVTLIVDYGVVSSSGDKQKVFGSAHTAFKPGVNIAAGNVGDHGSLLMYWGPKSGGFPAYAFVQQPIHSDLPFARDITPASTEKSAFGEANLVADPPAFEAAADDALGKAIPKLVSAMAANR